jgi:predicted transcriptional regulator
VYDLTEKSSCSGYKYVGTASNDNGQSKSGKIKKTPYIKDILEPGQTKSYRQVLEDIMIAFNCGKTTAKTILKDFREEGLVIKTKSDTGELSYTSIEKPLVIK